MKENEIMIGDWVRSRYKDRGGSETVLDFKVNQLIRRYNLEMCVYSDTADMGYASQIEPIPLTAEILEKNGFREDAFSPYRLPVGDGSIRLRENQCGYGFYCQIFLPFQKYCGGFNYVHQLQNAMRLCGIEKEITL